MWSVLLIVLLSIFPNLSNGSLPDQVKIGGDLYTITYDLDAAGADGHSNCMTHHIQVNPYVLRDRMRLRETMMHEFAHVATGCVDSYKNDQSFHGSDVHTAIYYFGENLGDLLIDNPQWVPLFTNR